MPGPAFWNMRVLVEKSDRLLSEILAEGEFMPDMRCGGNGTCGRCRVTLVSGVWEAEGEIVSAPAEALACRTKLLSDSGEVDLVPIPGNGKISAEWNALPLPAKPETVIAFDIGTTTIAAVKIRNGEVTAKASCFNAQSKYGDNVVTRIHYAGTDLAGLQNSVLDSIRPLLLQLGTEDVRRIAVAGNTVMTCLFHGLDPSGIGVLPFTPPARIFPERNDLFDEIPVLTVPCIAGYVGGDITAGLYETKLKPGEMLIDIGTNCEIVFHTEKGIFCTAAAAGPAFEGAGMGCGRRAVDGAIDHYSGNGKYTVIGNGKPDGLCGSGMVDFLAVERAAGHLNEFGRIQPKNECFEVADGVKIYECDIEQLLKAKAAVWAGIRTLESYVGAGAEKIYLAGGFAQYLNLENAVRIGMLPERKYEIVGNTSLAGAARLAVSPEIETDLEALIDLPRELPLNTLPGFEDNFIDGLLLN